MAETRLDLLEQRIDRVEDSLMSCSVEKDARIESMHSDMTMVHKDMGALKQTVQDLTMQVKDAVGSLKQIAENTTAMSELTELYSRWKGFTWVIKSMGFWVSIALALIVGGIISAVNGVAL